MTRRSLYINLFVDIISLTAMFLFMVWIKPASRRIYLPTYLYPFLAFLVIWVIISLISEKYSAPEKMKLGRAMSHILITNLIISGIGTLLIFGLHLQIFSRLIVIGTIAGTTILELFFAFCFFLKK